MKRQTFNEINITPLTDIFLVLLIIMMVIAPILDQQGLSLAVPEYVEDNNSQAQDNKILTVKVSADDKYYINNSQVDEKNLIEVIKQESQEKSDGLLIEANGQSSHKSVVKVMDVARNAGVTSISIVEM